MRRTSLVLLLAVAVGFAAHLHCFTEWCSESARAVGLAEASMLFGDPACPPEDPLCEGETVCAAKVQYLAQSHVTPATPVVSPEPASPVVSPALPAVSTFAPRTPKVPLHQLLQTFLI